MQVACCPMRIQVNVNRSTVRASFYIPEATHYNKYPDGKQFVSEAHRPQSNVFVVGETVALHQGWCEGALETVQDVIHDLT